MKRRIHYILVRSNLLQIVSCFLIFAFLTNLVYIPCYLYIMDINRENVIEHHKHQLENGMQTLNASMDALISLPNTVTYNTDFHTTYYSRSDFNDKTLDNIRQTMNACLLPFDCISENGLTLGDSILFTRNRIYYDLEPLSYHSFFSWDRETYLSEFTGVLCVLPSTHFSTVESEDLEAITIARRFRQNNDIYFFALYPLEKLFALFANKDVLESGYLAIYADDVLLAESGVALSKDFEQLTATGNNQLDIHVKLQLADSYIQQDLSSMTRLIWIFTTIVIMTALLWIIIFSFVLWKPYHNISNALYNLGRIQPDTSGKNFTDSLVEGINRLGDQLSDYEHILKIQKERSRIHIFEKALYRGLYSEESREAFHNAFPNFPDKWQLVQLQYVSDDDSITSDSIQPVVIQQLQFYWDNLFFLPPSSNTLLALVPLTPNISAIDIINELIRLIEQRHPFSISASFSQIYDDPSFLIDAAQDLEYEELSVSSESKNSCISMLQLQTIYSALQCGDAKTAIRTLNNCVTKFFDCNDRLSAKYTYRMLGYLLVRLKLENNIIDVPLPAFKENNIHKLFEEDLPQCFVRIAESLKQQQIKQTEKLDQDILDFIQANLANQQLGVSLVIEHFSISAPTLQKRMQACCQMTFSAYVETSRMEKAKQLLRDTDATVQEIAETVGYINANSFYKAYKRRYGEPPLIYRNQHGSKL